MKKTFLFSLCAVLACFAFLLFPSSSLQVYAEGNNRISVSGSAEIKLQPDIAMVHVGAETSHKNAAAAQQENAEIMNRLMEKMLSAGIEKNDIVTSSFNIYPKYQYWAGEQKPDGYQVTNIVRFKTKNLDALGQLLSDLAAAGANVFNGIQFTVENSDAVYNQALAAALQNAKDKAAALVGNLETYTLTSIAEENSYYNAYSYCDTSSMVRGVSAESVPVMKGEIAVKANIKAEFEKN